MCPPRFERPPLVGRAVIEAGTLPGGPQSLPGAGDTQGESCRGRGLSQEWGRGSIPTSPVAAPHPAGDRQTPSQPAEFRGQSTNEETEAPSAREASPNTRDGKSWSPVGLAVMPVQSRLEAGAAAPAQDPRPRAGHCVTSGGGALPALCGGSPLFHIWCLPWPQIQPKSPRPSAAGREGVG